MMKYKLLKTTLINKMLNHLMSHKNKNLIKIQIYKMLMIHQTKQKKIKKILM